MNWSTIGNLVGKAAPLVGGLLGGPAGAAAGKMVADFLGTEPTPEAVSEALKADPEAFVKLRQMETEKETELARLASEDYRAGINAAVESEKIGAADRENARDREKQLRLSGHHNYRADIMLALAFFSLLAIIYMVWVEADKIPQHVFALFNMAAGMLLKMISDAFQFEFGSSRGSKEKTLLGRVINK